MEVRAHWNREYYYRFEIREGSSRTYSDSSLFIVESWRVVVMEGMFLFLIPHPLPETKKLRKTDSQIWQKRATRFPDCNFRQMLLNSIHFLVLQHLSMVCSKPCRHCHPSRLQIEEQPAFTLWATERNWNGGTQKAAIMPAVSTNTGTTEIKKMLYAWH